jgi:four helix bundle protein
MEEKNSFKVLDDCYMLFRLILNVTEENIQYKYTLNQHIIRTCISIGSNLAESTAFNGKERNRFFNIALGSIAELDWQLGIYSIEITKYEEIKSLIQKIRAITKSSLRSSLSALRSP